jgi:hypothetical protein
VASTHHQQQQHQGWMLVMSRMLRRPSRYAAQLGAKQLCLQTWRQH